jgi:hypothetical protein
MNKEEVNKLLDEFEIERFNKTTDRCCMRGGKWTSNNFILR